jgi:hypothetical protein
MGPGPLEFLKNASFLGTHERIAEDNFRESNDSQNNDRF